MISSIATEIAERNRYCDTALNAQNALIYTMRRNGVVNPENSEIIKELGDLISEEHRKIKDLEDKLEAQNISFESFEDEDMFTSKILDIKRRLRENNEYYLTARTSAEKCMLREERYKLEDKQSALEFEFNARCKYI